MYYQFCSYLHRLNLQFLSRWWSERDSHLAQIDGPSMAVFGNRWKMLVLGNGCAMLGTESPIIWSVTQQDSEKLTVGPL